MLSNLSTRFASKIKWGNVSQLVMATTFTTGVCTMIFHDFKNISLINNERLKYINEIKTDIKDKNSKVINYLVDNTSPVPNKREIANLLDDFKMINLYLENNIVKPDEIKFLSKTLFKLLSYPNAKIMIESDPDEYQYVIELIKKLDKH